MVKVVQIVDKLEVRHDNDINVLVESVLLDSEVDVTIVLGLIQVVEKLSSRPYDVLAIELFGS